MHDNNLRTRLVRSQVLARNLKLRILCLYIHLLYTIVQYSTYTYTYTYKYTHAPALRPTHCGLPLCRRQRPQRLSRTRHRQPSHRLSHPLIRTTITIAAPCFGM